MTIHQPIAARARPASPGLVHETLGVEEALAGRSRIGAAGWLLAYRAAFALLGVTTGVMARLRDTARPRN